MDRKVSGQSPSPSRSLLIPTRAGEKFDTGRLGIHWKINSTQTGGRFAVIHHRLPPRALAAPLHRHHREDEHSYVLSGSLGALLGDEVVRAERGHGYSSREGSGIRSGTRATRCAKSS